MQRAGLALAAFLGGPPITNKKKKLSRRLKSEKGEYAWASWSNQKLLDTRICDLDLRIEHSELDARIRQLRKELRDQGFVFRPHFWLSDEWYSPDGVPGVGIPFFLVHPRLKSLENEHMLEVEGGTRDWCMKLLRHETGHAVVNAYQLHRRRSWQQHFGKSSVKYPDSYLPRPYSKRFVIHLDNWYAQSHPDEDWAETFAVWLTPRFDWRARYRGWPAVKKLEYVDTLMNEIKSHPPKVTNRRRESPVSSMRITLHQFYREKEARYGRDFAGFYDRDLRRLFSDKPEHKANEKASRYIRRVRHEVMNIVSNWASEYNYRINEVLKEMTNRCDRLDLRVGQDEDKLKLQLVAYLTTLIMDQLHAGGFHVTV